MFVHAFVHDADIIDSSFHIVMSLPIFDELLEFKFSFCNSVSLKVAIHFPLNYNTYVFDILRFASLFSSSYPNQELQPMLCGQAPNTTFATDFFFKIFPLRRKYRILYLIHS